MKRAARWLLTNLPLMVMALVLAALAWFVALDNADPTLERRFNQPITIDFTEPPEDMLIVEQSDEYVQVTLRTTQSVWDSLESSDFEVRVDLQVVEVGVQELPVTVELDKQPSKIISVEPDTVIVRADSRGSRIVPIRVAIEGRPALGYIPRAQVLNPRDVTVRGPTSYVTRVVEAFAAVSIEDAREDFDQTVTVRPRDSDGNSVPNVSLTPSTVDVLIPIEPSGYHTSLAVKAVLTGVVTSGYRVTDIIIDPPTVTVFGNPDDLAELQQGFIETNPVNVDGARDDVTVRPGLSVPPKVSVVPGGEVEVRVLIAALESSVTITATPQIQGLEPGYAVTVSPDVVELILSGPLPKLESLRADEVRVVLDLFQYPLGTHQIVPEIVTPQDIVPQSLIPETVQVRISDMPTPTPQVQSTLTGTLTATTTTTPVVTDQ